MKKNFGKLFLLSTVLLSLMTFSVASAQTPRGSIPQIHVINLVVPDRDVVAGGQVTGTYTLFNNSANNAPDVSYSVILVGDYKDGQPTVVYDEQKLGTTFLAVGEKKTMPFTYKLPTTVTGSDLAIRIQIMYAGFYLGWEDARIMVKGTTSLVQTDSAEILVGDIPYGTEIGAVVEKDKTVAVRIKFSNKTTENITFTPSVKIYNRINTGELLNEFKSDIVTVEGGKSKTVTVNLPTFDYKPLVYAGEIDFLDQSGQPKAIKTTFRYMIMGDMASIQTATSQSQSGSAGDVVNVDVLYGRPPADQNTMDAPKVGTVDVRVSLFDGAGNAVGESVVKLDLNKVGNKISVPVTLTANASSLKVLTTIEKNGAILAKDTNNLTGPKKPEPVTESINIVGVIAGLFIVGIILLILLVVIFKMRKPKNIQSSTLVNQTQMTNKDNSIPPSIGGTIALFIVASVALFSFMLAPNSAHAYIETAVTTMGGAQEYPALFINKPLDNQTLRPGNQFYIAGRQEFWSCSNESRFDSTIKIGFNGATSTHTFSNESAGTSSIVTKTFNYGPFTAPSIPGTYRIFFRADTRAYGINPDGYSVNWGSYWDGSSEGYVDIVVAGSPLVPPVLTATTSVGGGPACDASVYLSWNNIENGIVYVLIREDEEELYIGYGLNYLDSGLTPNTSYTYYVIAFSQDETFVQSVPVTIVAKCSPVSATVVGSPNPVLTGQTVNWNVSVSGGNPPYAYVITGTDGLNVSNSSSLLNFGTTKTYSTAGTKTASVTITSADGQVKNVSASVPVTVNNTFSNVSCTVSPSAVTVGQPVTWSCTPNPSGDYTYSWSGTDSLSGSTLTVTKQYQSVGIKSASFDVVGQGSTPDWTGTVNVTVSPIFKPI